MGKRKDISSFVYANVEALFEFGLLSMREIVVKCGIHHSSVIKIKSKSLQTLLSHQKLVNAAPSERLQFKIIDLWSELSDKILCSQLNK